MTTDPINRVALHQAGFSSTAWTVDYVSSRHPLRPAPSETLEWRARPTLVAKNPFELHPAHIIRLGDASASTVLGIEVDRTLTGYPGETAATLVNWPHIFSHPELDLAETYLITTLLQDPRFNIKRNADWAKATYAMVAPTKEKADIKFHRLAKIWKDETKFTSDSSERLLHPAYLEIIGMGPFAITYILRDLELNGGHWFAALKAITGHDPVSEEDQGRIPKMRTYWLEWGQQHGYISSSA